MCVEFVVEGGDEIEGGKIDGCWRGDWGGEEGEGGGEYEVLYGDGVARVELSRRGIVWMCFGDDEGGEGYGDGGVCDVGDVDFGISVEV